MRLERKPIPTRPIGTRRHRQRHRGTETKRSRVVRTHKNCLSACVVLTKISPDATAKERGSDDKGDTHGYLRKV